LVSDPRRLAWKVLVAVESGAFADAELGRALRSEDLQPRDHALATNLVYGTLAWQGLLDHVISTCGQRPQRLDPPIRTLLRLALYQLVKLTRVPQFAAVDTAVELAKDFRRGAASGLVNAVLRRFLREGRDLHLPADVSDPAGNLAVELSHPRWLVERWCLEIGAEQTRALLEANNEAAPTVLRAVAAKGGRDAALAALTRAGVTCRATRYAAQGIVVEGGGDPHALAGAREGLCIAQGEASQLVAAMMGNPPGWILDACAAPGGKAVSLAECCREDARVVAVDRSRTGLIYARTSAHRLGVDRLAVVCADARRLPFAAHVLFDAVLLDAPCSGLGTLRQHPEIRWRRQPGDIEELATLQTRLLAEAAPRVHTGGALVYATCTLLRAENEDQIDAFLAAHPQFAIDDPRPLLPAPAHVLVDERGFLRTWPQRDGLDGFFAARLKRLR
jgi:16S rRNA (cytosine967-C5)-methyltransferase